jgi:hypothetical protein
MVKLHKSSPVSKRNGVKKEFCHYVTDKQYFMNISLTAMGINPREGHTKPQPSQVIRLNCNTPVDCDGTGKA